MRGGDLPDGAWARQTPTHEADDLGSCQKASKSRWVFYVRKILACFLVEIIPLSQHGVSPPAQILPLEPYWEHATCLQLQYSRLVILFFNGVLWPHVTGRR